MENGHHTAELMCLQISASLMVLTGGRVVNSATNIVTSHDLETGNSTAQQLEKQINADDVSLQGLGKTSWKRTMFLIGKS